jgi:hypothetical protein
MVLVEMVVIVESVEMMLIVVMVVVMIIKVVLGALTESPIHPDLAVIAILCFWSGEVEWGCTCIQWLAYLQSWN